MLTNEYEEKARLPSKGLILCDCNGTLFAARAGEAFNKALLTFLKELKEEGYEVVIFSNDPDGNQRSLEMVSRALFGNSDLFGEIQRKDTFDGKTALVVFDDDHASHNVVGAYKASPTQDFQEVRRELASIQLLGRPKSGPTFGTP